MTACSFTFNVIKYGQACLNKLFSMLIFVYQKMGGSNNIYYFILTKHCSSKQNIEHWDKKQRP